MPLLLTLPYLLSSSEIDRKTNNKISKSTVPSTLNLKPNYKANLMYRLCVTSNRASNTYIIYHISMYN